MSELLDEFKPLDPLSIKIVRDEYHDIVVKKEDKEYKKVQVLRAFPYSQKNNFILLKNEEENEIGMLKDISGLDQKSYKILIEELNKKYFIPVITKIYDIILKYRTPIWSVKTDRGLLTFELRRRRNAKFINSRHVVIKDSEGNKYEIPDYTKLDEKSQRLIEREV